MTRNAMTAPKRSISRGLLFAVIVIALALGVAIMAARPGTATAPSATAAPTAAAPPIAIRAPDGLKARETAFDFGSISMAAGTVTRRFWFKNESATSVLIRKIYTSCMCTTATLVKGMKVINTYGMPGHGPLPEVNESLKPGEAAYVDVAFDPAAHGPAGLGPTQRVVTIESEAGQRLELQFAANVRP